MVDLQDSKMVTWKLGQWNARSLSPLRNSSRIHLGLMYHWIDRRRSLRLYILEVVCSVALRMERRRCQNCRLWLRLERRRLKSRNQVGVLVLRSLWRISPSIHLPNLGSRNQGLRPEGFRSASARILIPIKRLLTLSSENQSQAAQMSQWKLPR